MITVAELAERIGAELIGEGSGCVTAVGPIEASSETDVTFVADGKRAPLLSKSKAAAAIVNKQFTDYTKPQLVVANVNTALIEALKIFAPKLRTPKSGIAPSAVVGENVELADSASIGACAVIADNAQIGKNSVIAAGCVIGENSVIGNNCRLDSNVVVHHNCSIGNNVIIQSNTTIGSTGFGYTLLNNTHQLIPHNGGVVIEDFVEIGANCCVDRAKFGNTVIGAGTKVDNLVQIAHNVVIGKCCLIVGQAGIAGSSKLGDGVVLAGQVGIVDNVEIGSGTIVGAQAGVMRDTPPGKKVMGSPAIDYTEEIRLIALRTRLPKMVEQLKQLAKRVEFLETSKNNKE
jgi:UDP-3-O-[3-hydroxymyristoyl] glucosamine N-acyltransferase